MKSLVLGKQKAATAFTLIELLVVISIIAILMAILMPALSKVKSQATMIVCSSQLKDLGTAMNIYVAENDGKLPDSQNLDDQGNPVQGGRWYVKLAPYYNRSTNYDDIVSGKEGTIYDYNLFRCPTQEKIVKRIAEQEGGSSPGAFGTYGYNIYFTNYLALDKFNWRKASSIKTPDSLPLMADLSAEDPVSGDGEDNHAGWRLSGDYPHPNAVVKYGWEGSLKRGQYNYFGPAPNHDGKTNYLFADGHTESLGIWPWRDHKGTDFHPVRNVNVNP